VHESVERDVVRRIAEAVADIADPWDRLITGMRTYLDLCTEPTVRQITLIDGPSVLGWKEWREIDARYGLRMVEAALLAAMEAGRLRRRPVAPLAHLLLAAMGEAGLMVATAADPAAERAAVEEPLLTLLAGLRT
jgi:hypothetical protein